MKAIIREMHEVSKLKSSLEGVVYMSEESKLNEYKLNAPFGRTSR